MRQVTIPLFGRHGEKWPELPTFEVKQTGFSWSCWQQTAEQYSLQDELLSSVVIDKDTCQMTFINKVTTNV